jgi:hypothetical protein
MGDHGHHKMLLRPRLREFDVEIAFVNPAHSRFFDRILGSEAGVFVNLVVPISFMGHIDRNLLVIAGVMS